MKYIWMALMFMMFGCAGIKPQDQVAIDSLYQFGLLKVMKANPNLVPKITDIATQAKQALDSNTSIITPLTKAQAAKWIADQVNSKIGNDPDAKLLLQIVIANYMPGWVDTTASVLSEAQKKDLYHAIDLTLATISLL